MAAISKQSNNNLNNIIYVSIAIPKIQIPQQCCSFVVRPITILLPSCPTWPHEITCSRIIIYVQRIKNVKIHNTKWKLREPVSCAVQKSRVPNRLYKIRAPCTIIIIIKVTHTNTHANERARARRSLWCGAENRMYKICIWNVFCCCCCSNQFVCESMRELCVYVPMEQLARLAICSIFALEGRNNCVPTQVIEKDA